MRNIIAFTALIFLSIAPCFAAAPTLIIPDDLTLLDIGESIEYIEDDPGLSGIDDIIKNDREWSKNTNNAIDLGYSTKPYWFRFTYRYAGRSEHPVYLEIGNNRFEEISFYLDIPGKPLSEIHTGTSFPFSSRDIQHNNFIFYIQDTIETAACYFRIYATDSLKFNVTIHSDESFHSRLLEELPFLWMFYGLLFTVFIYSTAAFFTLREKAFLFFALYILGCILLFLNINGLSFRYIWPELPWWQTHSTYSLLSLQYVLIFLFMKFFFDTAEKFPKQDFVIKKLIIIPLVPTTVLPLFLNRTWLMYYKIAIQIVSIFLFICFIAILFQMALKKSRQAYYLSIGFLCGITGAIISILKNFDILPITLFTQWSWQAGFSFQIFFFSFGLFDRYHGIRKSLDTTESELIKKNTELNAANKELRATMEELEATNEELQATMEELEATNEEFEAQNEELAYSYNELNKNEELLRLILDEMPIAVSLFRKFSTEYVNKPFVKLFGYTREELPALEDMLTKGLPEADKFRKEIILQYFQKGPSFKTPEESITEWIPQQIITKNGKTIEAEIRIAFIGEMAIALFDDVTERKKIEDELKNNRQFLSTLIEHSSAGFCVKDKEGRYLLVNREWEKGSGFRREEVLGKTDIDIYDRERAEIYMSHDRLVMQSGEKKETELYENNRYHYIIAYPFTDDNGMISGVSAFGADITKLKKAEEERDRYQEHIRNSQKIEAIGTLAGGIAHDFNNILTGITGYAEIALRHIQKDEKLKEYLSHILSAGKRAADLVHQILTLSRKNKIEMQPSSIGNLVNESLKLLRPSIPSTIDIITTNKADNDIVNADETQIHQVIMNLCTNAAYAMKKNGGTLSITLSNKSIQANNLNPDLGISPGEYLVLRVADTGHGISPEIIDKIFDPFFTTKEKGEGTGLGLSVAYGIIKKHEGDIHIESRINEGSAFSVYLPLIQNAILQETVSEVPGLSKGNEHILYVDDEPLIAELAKEMLNNLGYEVDIQTNSTDALNAFRSCPDLYKLVITDQTMPGMTGLVLASEIKQIRENIPVILCTGFSEDITPDTLIASGISELMMKPLNIQDLSDTVRKVLDAVGESES
ncbi:MAG: PAS domain S-box protein [Spirochaetes bacterium]|nr:PAS domain S-box protein [Spirochaetota bacterium]